MSGPADVPVGGTTGLCHQSSEAITLAANWYRANRDTCPRPVVPMLQQRFGLTIAETISALREANGRKGG